MIQDACRNDPWKVLAACVLLNRCRGAVARWVLADLIGRWATPDRVAGAPMGSLSKALRPCGLQGRRARTLLALSCRVAGLAREGWDFAAVRDVPGMGPYAEESFRVFVGRDRTVRAGDREVAGYLLRSVPVRLVARRVALDLMGGGRPLGKDLVVLEGYRYGFDDGVFCGTVGEPGESLARTDARLGDGRLSVAMDGDRVVVDAGLGRQDVADVARDADLFSRVACLACERWPSATGYLVRVRVGEMIMEVAGT